MNDWQPRELVITHEGVWELLEELFEDHDCKMTLGQEGDAENLPWYVVTPNV